MQKASFLLAAFLLSTSVSAAPLATVRVNDVPSLLAAIMQAREGTGPRRIELVSGTYRITAPIVLDDKLSGTPNAPFVLTATRGDHVVISGATELLPLDWKPWKNGIWKAKLARGSFQRLWQGGRLLIRARYPNYDPSQLPFGGTAADAIAPERVARWKNPAGGVLSAIHASRWGGIYQEITGKDGNGALIFGPITGNNRASLPHERFRYVENIFEELDAPGEWYLNKEDGYLYFKSQDSGRPPATGFTASVTDELIRIEGTKKAAHDIVVENITLEDTEPTILKATEPLLRSDWMFYRSGAVTIENAERVRIANTDLHEIGGNAIVVSGHARHVTITGNNIWSIGGTAIAFVGRPAAVRSALFEYYQSLPLAAIDRIAGPKSDAYPAQSVAQDNLIHDIGLIDKNAAGVQLSMSARITVDHNSIYRGPRAGINVGDGNWGGHRITNNDVFDTVRESSDHGAFNSWGRDRYWHPDRAEMDRRVAVEPSLVTLDAREPIILKHNRFRCDHGWDIDLDDGATNYRIEDNLLLAGGLKLREGFFRVVRNNVLVNNTFHPHVWFAGSGDVFEHNIVMTAYQPIRLAAWGKSVDFNAFVNAEDLKQAQIQGTDAHSLAGNLQFIAPALGNFAVRSSSPVLKTGFKNFAMDNFGVRPARLKALAEKPLIPDADSNFSTETLEPPKAFAGLMIKSVQTLGEQSAAGLATRDGVIIVSVDAGGPADRAGLRRGDIITGIVDGNIIVATPTATTFISKVRAARGRDAIIVEVRRNQAQRRVTLPLP